jgi:hypothetical protein
MARTFVAAAVSRARLRFAFRTMGWTETYWLDGTPGSNLAKLNYMSRLRSYWMGKGVRIEFASCSDPDNPRDGVAADSLPYTNPASGVGPLALAGPINDPNVGLEYRLQRLTDSVAAYRTFRGIPDSYIQNFLASGGPWLPTLFGNRFDAAHGPLYDPADLWPGAPIAPAVGGVPNDGSLYASSWLNFLCQLTVAVHQVENVGPPITWTWTSLGSWDDVVFRRVKGVRTGHPFAKRAGRFSR